MTDGVTAPAAYLTGVDVTSTPGDGTHLVPYLKLVAPNGLPSGARGKQVFVYPSKRRRDGPLQRATEHRQRLQGVSPGVVRRR